MHRQRTFGIVRNSA